MNKAVDGQGRVRQRVVVGAGNRPLLADISLEDRAGVGLAALDQGEDAQGLPLASRRRAAAAALAQGRSLAAYSASVAAGPTPEETLPAGYTTVVPES